MGPSGYTCLVNRDYSRYIYDDQKKIVGCAFYYNTFSIGIKDWDNNQQICSYSSFTEEPFFTNLMIVVSVIVALILVIFISIGKSAQSKPLAQPQDYVKQDSFSGLHD